MCIGKGGMGKVFLTHHDGSNKFYALKQVKIDARNPQVTKKLTERETTVMFDCNHPNVITLYMLFKSETNYYLLMPLITGSDLYGITHFNITQKEITKSPQGSKKKEISISRFPLNIIKFFAVQMVLAIGHLHQKGYAHRDLKLENFMVTEDGYIQLIDFGLSKKLTGKDMTQVGTPMYMPPEMYKKGTKHSYAVDWWEMGIVFYELAIGTTPYELKLDTGKFTTQRKPGATMRTGIMDDVLNPKRKHFWPPKGHDIKLSAEFMDLVDKMIQKDADSRIGGNHKDGYKEILKHEFFKGENIDDYINKKVKVPFQISLT